MLSCILSKRGDFLSGRGIDQLLCHVPVVEKDENESGVKSLLWLINIPLLFWLFVSRSLLFGLRPCSNPPMLTFANHA